MRSWQLQEAKTHFSKLVKKAMTEGPQHITVRGEPSVILLSKADFDQLRGAKKVSLPVLMRNSPLAKLALNISRDSSYTRDVDL